MLVVVIVVSVECDYFCYGMLWEVLGWFVLVMIVLLWFNGLLLCW